MPTALTPSILFLPSSTIPGLVSNMAAAAGGQAMMMDGKVNEAKGTTENKPSDIPAGGGDFGASQFPNLNALSANGSLARLLASMGRGGGGGGAGGGSGGGAGGGVSQRHDIVAAWC